MPPTLLLALCLGQTIDVTEFGARGDDDVDDRAAIASAVAALPPRGGKLYFPPGEYVTYEDAPLVEVVDRDNVTVLGDGAGIAKLRKISPGICIALSGGTEIVGARVTGLTILGSENADVGILFENAKDSDIDHCTIAEFRRFGIEGRGASTLNVLVTRCRISAASNAYAEGRALSVRQGTTWRAEANYFNVGGSFAHPRWDTAVDVRGNDGFYSEANIFDGAETGLRSDGEITSIADYWDSNPAAGIWGFCYAHEQNNPITIIGPRGATKRKKVNLRLFNAKKYLTFVRSGPK